MAPCLAHLCVLERTLTSWAASVTGPGRVRSGGGPGNDGNSRTRPTSQDKAYDIK